MSSTPITISVIIPVHNGSFNFRFCLESLFNTNPLPNEIIVVANGDTDGSSQLAQEFGTRVIRIAQPVGPARARNIGAKEANSEILFFLDADVTVKRNTIMQVAANFTDNNSPTAIIGSYDDTPAMTNFMSQYKNLMHHYVHQVGREKASTFWGACGAIRRDVFLEMGGFDESYLEPSIEDIELGYRLNYRGYEIKLVKNLQVKHLKRWGMVSLVKTDFFCRALPWAKLIIRNRNYVNDLNISYSSRISVLFSYGVLFSLAAYSSAPWTLTLAGLLLLIIVVLNVSYLQFFVKKRGLGFTILAFLWYYFYFLYSGLAFLIALVHYNINRLFYPEKKQTNAGSG